MRRFGGRNGNGAIIELYFAMEIKISMEGDVKENKPYVPGLMQVLEKCP